MEPLLLMTLLGLAVTLAVAACLLVPIYAGMYASLYWIYQPEKGQSHPIAGQFFEREWVLAHYEQLYGFWQSRPDGGDIALQLFAPPVVGALVGLGCLWLLYRHVRGMFRVDDL